MVNFLYETGNGSIRGIAAFKTVICDLNVGFWFVFVFLSENDMRVGFYFIYDRLTYGTEC